MDILPAQASAVACERVFSSSKATCTLNRSRLSPQLMEALQILKYLYKQDYTIEGPVTARAVDELMAGEKYVELGELLSNGMCADLGIMDDLPDVFSSIV